MRRTIRDKTIGAAPPKATLHLKRPVEQGTVRQSFSHGRSKAVVVEKVKRRISGPGEAPPQRAAPDRRRQRRRPRLRPRFRRGEARPGRARKPAPAAAAAQDRRRPAHPDGRAARSAQPGAARRARAGGGGSPPTGGGSRGAARTRGARTPEREAAEARKREEELRRAQEANFRRQSEDEARRRWPAASPAPSRRRSRASRAATAPGVALPGALARPAGEEEEAGASPGVPRSLPPAQKASSRRRGRPAAANSAIVAG